MPRDNALASAWPVSTAALAIWRSSLGELALACAGSYAAEESLRVREMATLIGTAPEGLAATLPQPDLARIETLLAVGAGTSAALVLIGAENGLPAGGANAALAEGAPADTANRHAMQSDAGFLLSCGGNGRHMASVVLPGNAAEQTASGDTAALALVGALALALADQAEAVIFPGIAHTAAQGLPN